MTRKHSANTQAEALAHTNRKGVTYYLHEGRTKSGNPRYFFARSIGAGSLAELPTGYEIAESINGVVSVRRHREGEIAIPDDDLALVRTELGRHAHLRHHVALADRDAIVIHQPDVDLAELHALSRRLPPGRVDQMLLYQLVEQHWPTFRERAEQSGRHASPQSARRRSDQTRG